MRKACCGGLNRTSVGLKRGPTWYAGFYAYRLNRTSVGLKHWEANYIRKFRNAPQSNQRGIETGSKGFTSEGGERLNRTSVGLKPLKLASWWDCGLRLNRTSVGLKPRAGAS